MPMTNFAILIVEDDEPKLRAINQFISDEFPGVTINIAESLTSAINSLVSSHVDFAIVDMSLPTYDFSQDRAGGGKPQGFGGEDILRFIETESNWTTSVVLTQYEEFPSANNDGRRSLQGLSDDLRSELGSGFFGVIHYSGQHGEWRSSIRQMILSVMEQPR